MIHFIHKFLIENIASTVKYSQSHLKIAKLFFLNVRTQFKLHSSLILFKLQWKWKKPFNLKWQFLQWNEQKNSFRNKTQFLWDYRLCTVAGELHLRWNQRSSKQLFLYYYFSSSSKLFVCLCLRTLKAFKSAKINEKLIFGHLHSSIKQ